MLLAEIYEQGFSKILIVLWLLVMFQFIALALLLGACKEHACLIVQCIFQIAS